MRSLIFDINNKEVKEGDTLSIPYIDPVNNLHVDTEDFQVVVIFKHGCFGYNGNLRFVPLFEWSEIRKGDYIPNWGTEEIITDNYLFKIVS